jgi:NTP pyrophosphatase (non-canonical NTP hydrolase)
MDNTGFKWKTSHGEFEVTEKNIPWIMQNAKTSMFNNDRSYIYNKAFYEAYFNPKHNLIESKTSERFDLIRDWAATRGLYEKGDPNTQYVKLQEECGELAKAMLQNDKPEIVDAIGDIVVVLTNLAHLQGYDIEHCIDEAYKVIAARTGKMINGTFVKDN